MDLDFGRDVDDSSFKRTENQFWHCKAFGENKIYWSQDNKESCVIKAIKDLYNAIFVIICY